jgi:hypothetical protein
MLSEQDKTINARAYMQEAYYLYSRWQAIAKAEFLINTYPGLLGIFLLICPAQTGTLKRTTTGQGRSTINRNSRALPLAGLIIPL